MNKTFITIFEKTENIHLIKDVGQIPYLMYKYFDYDSTIITYKNSDTYDFLENETKGLNLKFIPKIKIGRYSLSMLWFILKNAKKIDILNLYHHRDKTYLNFLLYKFLNPNGIAFLKSDIGLRNIQENQNFYPKKSKYFIRNWLFKRLLPKIDVISIESKEGYEIISNQIYPQFKNKFLYMPNGINIEKMYSLIKPISFDEKENLIITVGRIGAAEKNNELLLQAIEKIDLKNWKVAFIGPIEQNFQEKIDIFYTKNPNLKNKVIFTGAIYDRENLYEWYAKSKIFCMTSIEESFGFVFIEAMAYGNIIFTTPVSSAREISENEKCGEIVFDQKELEEILSKYIEKENDFIHKNHYAQQRALKYYNWKNILLNLDNFIKKMKDEKIKKDN